MSILLSKPEHEVAYQDLAALLRKHSDKLSGEEILAVGANMLGKLIALQDQRIEIGNQHIIGDLAIKSEGSA